MIFETIRTVAFSKAIEQVFISVKRSLLARADGTWRLDPSCPYIIGMRDHVYLIDVMIISENDVTITCYGQKFLETEDTLISPVAFEGDINKSDINFILNIYDNSCARPIIGSPLIWISEDVAKSDPEFEDVIFPIFSDEDELEEPSR
jgi:hypothetical protein